MDLHDIKRCWRNRYGLAAHEPTDGQLLSVLKECSPETSIGKIDQVIRNTCQTVGFRPPSGPDKKDLRDTVYELTLEFGGKHTARGV